MSNSGFKYFSSEFPSMPRPQYLPTNHNNTMLTKLDDLLGKITEVNNHLSNIESKYSKFEQFMTEKQESDLVVKENLNLLSKQSVEFKKDLVHHSLLIEQHDILFIKLIIPMFEDLFGLIVSQNQDKKGNILDIDLKLKLERYLIQMKKAKERWKKAEILLQWADDLFLAQALPNSSTSLRSNRIIDYAFVRGFNIGIQVYNGNTTSDHLPILSVIPMKVLQQKLGKNTHWKVFTLFSEYTFSFWEENWNLSSIDITYNDYIRFLHLLSARCSTYFYLNRYRSALPVELRSFLSYIRALSFRQIRTQCNILKKEICSLKRIAKKELNLFFSSQLDNLLRHRNSSSSSSNSFWYRSKLFLKPSSSSLHAFLDSSGQIVKESDLMCNIAADYYEEFFKASNIVRPHPYTDSPAIEYDNINEVIPEVKLDELINTVLAKKKKKSLDAHGISNYMFNFLDINYWSLLLKLYNHSFQKSVSPSAWKDTRMILLAKKDSICLPSLTRPISLLDSFQKIGEKLFLTRFRDLLYRRGLLPDSQSGFRERFRLQTRLLLFLEDIYFRAAFDQLWFLGCIGKLRNLGIPSSFLNWIEVWLNNRRCFIEINGSKSRWFSIEKGGPQGSVLTPTLFITYNCDMCSSLSGCINHFFADDLAGIMAGQLGMNYSSQCLDLEKRIKVFLDNLDYYSCLSDQPINFNKTKAMFSARAIGHPKFVINFRQDTMDIIEWTSEYKYLGYIISPKLGWASTSILQLTVKALDNTISQAYSYASRLVCHINMYQQHQILSHLNQHNPDFDSDSDDSSDEEDKDTTGNCTDNEDSSENDEDYVSNRLFKVISTIFQGMQVFDSINTTLTKSYFIVNINGTKIYLHRQIAAWLLSNDKFTLSSDRLKRIMNK
ncbi:unnamed protein product [Rotaria magnacalcarata]|uniref:Reverse transcriptase domain-containing protein n=2 Tax=Rotaria magnacalcarata TaxID=392030 RepID=A0A814RD93_9BILA|nr:unnamed protein product [Rotaria magnacalcarata]CAF1380262.1 unnamed protein product [Rotaria magnacalcarata]CAF2122454.1 unnamed protein product [Rotaria magnacalcarata]CAF3804173.1 unnamed protein product [Rotaria magnacalcarata]CAF3807811.1 unnamed protein product [Rotaria magnacalcarata]